MKVIVTRGILYLNMQMNISMTRDILYLEAKYSLLHLECHLISISNLNLLGLFSTERGK